MTAAFLFIAGRAQTQGSMQLIGYRGDGTAKLTTTNKNLKGWRNLVRSHIVDGYGKPKFRLEGAVQLELLMVFPRPKSMPKKAPLTAEHLANSDIDKLLRAVNDAISDLRFKGRYVSDGAFADDRQICLAVVEKRIAQLDEIPGAYLRLDAYSPRFDMATFERKAPCPVNTNPKSRKSTPKRAIGPARQSS